MGAFTLDLSRFKVKSLDQASKVVRKIALDMYAKLIVRKWPVDTGRSRANNLISLNSLPASSVLEVDKSGRGAIAAGGQVLAEFTLGDTIFLFNNVEYAAVLEFGGYPNPPKQGTWDKRKKRYVVQTEGGFSKQAPQGVYRLAIQTVIAHFDSMARGAGR